MMPVIAERMTKKTNRYLLLGNSLLSIFEPRTPVIKLRTKPVDKATLNNALSSIHLAKLISSTIQKMKNPGAEKNKEKKKTRSISPGHSLKYEVAKYI